MNKSLLFNAAEQNVKVATPFLSFSFIGLNNIDKLSQFQLQQLLVHASVAYKRVARREPNTAARSLSPRLPIAAFHVRSSPPPPPYS